MNLNTPQYTPDNANAKMEELRQKMMSAFTTASVTTEEHQVVCAGIESLLKTPENTEAQTFMQQLVIDGIVSLRVCVKKFWELKNEVFGDSVGALHGVVVSYFNIRINTEIQRLMTTAIGSIDKLALAPYAENQETYQRMRASIFMMHDTMSNDIEKVIEQLKAASGK